VRDHLQQADYGQIPNVSHEPYAGALRAVATQAEDVEVGQRRLEMTDQLRAVQVAGGFTAGEEEPRHEWANGSV
jgi:hypothetical protein